jgi:phosphogluconate 2-dehydrogenase
LGWAVNHNPVIDAATLRATLPNVDAYVLGGDERLDASALSFAHHLALISFVGTGYGSFIDEDAARSRSIAIRSTPGVMTIAVAEHTMGLLLGLVRGLFRQNEAVKRSGSWETTRELRTLTVGIVGLGSIGTRVAQLLRRGFASRVIYTSRTRKPDLEADLGLTFVDAHTLFSAADAVILLAPTTPETVGAFGADYLLRMKAGSFLVNTASAGLVDPTALSEALRSGRVSAAAFDGYWIEPLPAPASDPFGLLTLPDGQFVVTPHTAAKTIGTWDAMIDAAVQNLVLFFANRPPGADVG